MLHFTFSVLDARYNGVRARDYLATSYASWAPNLRLHPSHFGDVQAYVDCWNISSRRMTFMRFSSIFSYFHSRSTTSAWCEDVSVDETFRDMITGNGNFDPRKALLQRMPFNILAFPRTVYEHHHCSIANDLAPVTTAVISDSMLLEGGQPQLLELCRVNIDLIISIG